MNGRPCNAMVEIVNANYHSEVTYSHKQHAAIDMYTQHVLDDVRKDFVIAEQHA